MTPENNFISSRTMIDTETMKYFLKMSSKFERYDYRFLTERSKNYHSGDQLHTNGIFDFKNIIQPNGNIYIKGLSHYIFEYSCDNDYLYFEVITFGNSINLILPPSITYNSKIFNLNISIYHSFSHFLNEMNLRVVIKTEQSLNKKDHLAEYEYLYRFDSERKSNIDLQLLLDYFDYLAEFEYEIADRVLNFKPNTLYYLTDINSIPITAFQFVYSKNDIITNISLYDLFQIQDFNKMLLFTLNNNKPSKYQQNNYNNLSQKNIEIHNLNPPINKTYNNIQTKTIKKKKITLIEVNELTIKNNKDRTYNGISKTYYSKFLNK